jgi:hypothetical protein
MRLRKRFVIPPLVVEGDEPTDLLLKLCRRFPREQVHLLLARSVIPLDLAVGLRVERRGEDMADAFIPSKAPFRLPHTAIFTEPDGPAKIPGNPTPKPKTCTLKSGTFMCHFLRRRTILLLAFSVIMGYPMHRLLAQFIPLQ